MRSFLLAAVFVTAVVVVAGFVFEEITYTATEAYSTESARVGHQNPVDGRLGWSPDV